MKIDVPLSIDITESLAETKSEIAKLLQAHASCMIVVGNSVSAKIAGRLIDDYMVPQERFVKVYDNSLDTLNILIKKVEELNPEIVFAVGGGKVSDLVKRLCLLKERLFFLVPTIISNDGLISPISVLNIEGKSVSLPGRMPDKVLLDLSIISKTPQKFLRAAACDIISNVSALGDWTHHNQSHEEPCSGFASYLSRAAADSVLNCSTWNLTDIVFQKAILNGQVLSGLAMAIAGNSRPCSGSEHLISHAIDALCCNHGLLHGEVVGITSQFSLYLQNKNDLKVQAYFRHFEVGKLFPGIESETDHDIGSIFSTARKMRPNRRTVLDKYSDNELVDAYFEFQKG